MAKMTLLSMTQDILNDMNSDSVNSINDTVEAQQVAQVVKTTFFEIIGTRDWPHLATLVQLTGLSDTDKPNYMLLPEGIQKILWIKYNKKETGGTDNVFSDVIYKHPKEFLELVNTRNSSDTTNNKVVSDSSGITLVINKLTPPTFWTSFDDEYIVFDSYDSAVESTLQASKTQVHCYKDPVWTHTDGAIPDMPAKVFPYFLSEAKSTCFLVLKQVANNKEEQRSRRQRIWLAKEKWRENGERQFAKYGRK